MNTTKKTMNRVAMQTASTVTFYDDGDYVGEVDYRDKSQHFIDSAIENWETGIMTVETVEKYSIWYRRDGEVVLNVPIQNK